MRKLAFVLTLIGILILFLYMQFSSPIEITNGQKILELNNNQKVKVQGIVLEDITLKDSRLIKLENNISLYCDCEDIQNLKGKTISIIGIIDTFQYDKIEVLNIKIIN